MKVKFIAQLGRIWRVDLVYHSAAKRGLNLRLAWAMRCGFDLQLALVVKHCSARLALFCYLRER